MVILAVEYYCLYLQTVASRSQKLICYVPIVDYFEDNFESFANCSGGAQVLGRLCVDLRICACPGRDRKSDENKLSSSAASTPTTTAATTSQTNQSSAPTASVTTSTHTNKTEPATPLTHTGKTSLLLLIFSGCLNCS